MAFKRCEAIAKSGKRCQNGAMSLSPYCGSHQEVFPIQVYLYEDKKRTGSL